MNTIACPHCGTNIEISQALTSQLKERILAEEQEKHKRELAEVRQKVLLESEKKIKDQFDIELQRQKEEVQESKSRNKQLIEQVSQLMRDIRQLRVEKDDTKLRMEKKLVEEEEKIRLEAQKKAEEAQHTKLLEKEKQLQDALKTNEEMRRKLEQGSQQTQGEVFELEFEGLVQKQYPNDKVIPVGKGIRGGDMIQEVWDGRGNYVGKFLWELKNAKTWSDAWIDKLKTDKRSINAEEGILVSEILPSIMKTAGFRSGVWVTQRGFAIPLADTLRAKLIQLYYVKHSVEGKDAKMELLYQYLSGAEFKHRVEAIIDAFTNMQGEIEKEKRYFMNKWARDEKNIRQVVDNTYGMHGDLKGIVGSVLPQIKGIDLAELTDGKNV